MNQGIARWIAILAILSTAFLATRTDAAEPINNEKLLKMLAADLPESIIIKKLEDAAKDSLLRLDASTDDLIALKEAGATEYLLEKTLELSNASEKEARKAVDEMLRWSDNIGEAGENMDKLQHSINAVISYRTNAIPYLVKKGLASDKPSHLAAAIEALGKIGDSSIFDDIWQKLFHTDPKVREAAAKAVVILGPEDILEVLRTELKKTGRTRDGLLWAMGYLHDSRAETDLIDILANSRQEDNRSAAAFAMGELGEPTILGLERLKYGLLNDSSGKVRLTCAGALSRVANEDNDAALAMQRAFERHHKDRFYLVLAMSKYRYNSILVGFLISSVLPGDYAPTVKQAAYEALHAMTDADYTTSDEWRNWWRFASIREPYTIRVEKRIKDTLNE